MSTGAGIAVAVMWLSTAGTLCYFREDVAPFAIVVAFGIAAWATLAITGAR